MHEVRSSAFLPVVFPPATSHPGHPLQHEASHAQAFASDHIPASLVACPVPGDTGGLLSSPPPSAEFGHGLRQNERLHTAVMAAALGGHPG